MDLNFLVLPFSKEEINGVASLLPYDKALGPDGFNTDFLKKCWPIIREDLYALCQVFYEEYVCLRSINGSHIILVPKHRSEVKVVDFRPIYLLNTSVQLITKILANRF